ncbi:tetratricopeptide repeat protein [Collimonas humicola]|uniref:O-linked N-acetylglucosamine transferase, SPINDLY family protein n=1 Tax=Collimonas humicola TaxID=2825886 RepID=UPI001B8CBDEB|nr:tetratricopeptide repeat protein [Collimonas humicola]
MFKSFKNLFSSPEKKSLAAVAATASEEPSNVADERSRHIKRGNAFLAENDLHNAEICYRQALNADPAHVAPYITLGYVLKEQQRLDEARQVLTQGVLLDPQKADGFYMLGTIAKEQGDLAGTVENFNKALAVKPDFELIYTDLYVLFFQIHQIDAAKQLIKKGIAECPANADFHYYLGNLYFIGGDHEAAIISYREALAIRPTFPEALCNLGDALKNQGRLDDALSSYRTALALKPDYVQSFSSMLLTMQYHSAYTSVEVFNEHLRFAQLYELPLKPQWPRHANLRDPSRRLKIAYVSGDFRNHSIAFFIEPVLDAHDRSQFEIFAYYNYASADHVTERLSKKVDHWLSCAGMSDQQLAERIGLDGIDILVDLSGHTGFNRLLTFARKPAPLQLSWIGYQATTGLSAMDYRITDAAMDPPGTTEQFHTEKLLRLPSSAQFQPAPDSPPVNPLPALSSNEFTLACLNNHAKITQPAVHLWARILVGLPHARLMFGNASGSNAKQHLIDMFALENIAEDRLIFQPTMSLIDYLKLHQQIDLALDTFPYNGGTTTLHSLSMGVPVIALAGNTPVSRAGVATLGGAGIPEFAAYSEDEYVARAIEMAQDLPKLNEVRQSLRVRAAPLFNSSAEMVTRPLEEAYRTIWKKWCDS